MLGMVEVKVEVDVNAPDTPEPEELLHEIELALGEVEAKNPGVVFLGMRLVNLKTGLEVLKPQVKEA